MHYKRFKNKVLSSTANGPLQCEEATFSIASRKSDSFPITNTLNVFGEPLQRVAFTVLIRVRV